MMLRDLPPEVALFGEWNTSNLGDRAIHRGARAFFESCGWRTSSYAFGSLLPVDTSPAGGVRPADRVGAAAIRAVLPPLLAQALRGVRQRYRIARLLPALRRAQAISVGGGALLDGAEMHFPQSLCALTRAARVLRKPLLCLGCSTDGAWSPPARRALTAFAAACSAISARDEASARRIADLPAQPEVSVFGDFCLAEADLRDADRSGPARGGLALNVCTWRWLSTLPQRNYEDALVALACHWRAGRAIRVFTTGTAQDAAPARRVAERLASRGAELHIPESVEELSALLRASEVVLASRLHAAVLALAQGTALIGFSLGSKLRDYLCSMRLADYGAGPGAMARAVALLEHRSFEALRLAQRQAALRSPVWGARRALREALESAACAPLPGALRLDHARRLVS
ncbi:MAG: polysaccharide pyruvyl transferase family protein [Betaproteobacteria bacterium]|nr:polysaccharide pyruvyl transferase family protein [Betaproteobacteria bacterium]